MEMPEVFAHADKELVTEGNFQQIGQSQAFALFNGTAYSQSALFRMEQGIAFAADGDIVFLLVLCPGKDIQYEFKIMQGGSIDL